MAVNERIRIKVKGYEHAIVDAATAKIVEAAKRSGARVSGPIPLPTDKEIITVIRAVHKYKDSREQFEMRTHKRLIDVIRPTAKTTPGIAKGMATIILRYFSSLGLYTTTANTVGIITIILSSVLNKLTIKERSEDIKNLWSLKICRNQPKVKPSGSMVASHLDANENNSVAKIGIRRKAKIIIITI